MTSTNRSYIGVEPTYGNFAKQIINGNSSTTIFNLNFIAPSEESMLIVDNGILKQPDTDYTLINSNTQVQFAVAPITGHTIFILFLGQKLLAPTAGTFVAGSINPVDISPDYNKSLRRNFYLNANNNLQAQYNYYTDTVSGSITGTLPASATFGDTIIIVDVFGTFRINNLILNRNGLNINGVASNFTCNINNSIITLTYINSTVGWLTEMVFNSVKSSTGKIYYFSA